MARRESDHSLIIYTAPGIKEFGQSCDDRVLF